MSSLPTWLLSIIDILAALGASLFLRVKLGKDAPRDLARQVGSYLVPGVVIYVSGQFLIPTLRVSGGSAAWMYGAAAAWGAVLSPLRFGKRQPVRP